MLNMRLSEKSSILFIVLLIFGFNPELMAQPGQVNYIVPAQLLDFHIDPKTDETTLELRLDDGHDWHVVLGPGSPQRLYHHILHEHDEGRAKLLLRKET